MPKLEVVVFDVSGTLLDEVTSEAVEGIEPVLQQLYATGVQLAVATNLGRHSVHHVLHITGFEKYFTTVTHTDRAAFKPNTEMLEQVALECGATAKNMLMIGDSMGDVKMAKAFGCKVGVVSWGKPLYPQLIALEPDFAVQNPADLWHHLSTYMS